MNTKLIKFIINDTFIRMVHVVLLVIIISILYNFLNVFNYVKVYVVNQKMGYIQTIYYDTTHATPNQFDEVVTYCYVEGFYKALPKQCAKVENYSKEHNKNRDIYKFN